MELARFCCCNFGVSFTMLFLKRYPLAVDVLLNFLERERKRLDVLIALE